MRELLVFVFLATLCSLGAVSNGLLAAREPAPFLSRISPSHTVALESEEADRPSSGLRVAPQIFATSDHCMACHNNLISPQGEDVSIGADWRATMMANSARDPYWQAAVRRETLDHPTAQAAIEDECSKCHMPMARYQAHVEGLEGRIFAQLPIAEASTPEALLAADGVSCTACHQIQDQGLGTRESFVGGFVIDQTRPFGQRQVFGPFEIDRGRTTIMRSAARFVPTQSLHVRKSELCATCHTLYTNALDNSGRVIGELPEQVPYLEWKHSTYRDTQSCQSCHMPVVESEMPISGVLGLPREGLSRHTFRGGNFLILRMLNRYRDELGVKALDQELDTAARQTIEHLQTSSARLDIEDLRLEGDRLQARLKIENLGGHKLPTAYPARRSWIHFSVLDSQGNLIFESGRLQADGSIVGNDNDSDAARYEPHYERIESPEQVQIYEAIMVDPQDRVTTGLLTAVRFIKDNRLLPHGFEKSSAEEDIAVRGAAAEDPDFEAPGDRILYRVPVPLGRGPFRIEAELWFQPIGYRWAHNLAGHGAMETDRFVNYYESMSDASAVILTRSTADAR